MEASTESATYLAHAELTQSSRGQNREGEGDGDCTVHREGRGAVVGAPPPCLERLLLIG